MTDTSDKEQLIAEIDDIILWGTIAAPFVVILTFSPLNLDYFGLPKLTALYLVTLFLIYLQVRKWLATGSIEIPVNAGLLISGLFVLGITVTALTSASPLASFIGRFNRYEAVPGIMCYAIILWFAYKAAQDRLFAKRFDPVLMGTFAIVTVYGMFEVFGFDMLHSHFQTEGRISSTLGNPVFFGSFLAVSLPMLLAKALLSPRDDKRVWDHPVVLYGLLCLGTAMLFSTISRAAWLGVFAGSSLVLYQKIVSKKELQAPKKNYWMLLIVAGILLGVIFSASINSGVTRVFDKARTSGSLDSRVEIWKSSLPMIADRPLSGYGLGQTGDWFNKYTTLGLARLENSYNDRAHNIYLQTAIDGGLLLLLIQLWLVIFAISKGAKAMKRGENRIAVGLVGGIIGYLVQGFFGIATIDLSIFFWFIMGAGIGTATKRSTYTLRRQLRKGLALRATVLPLLLILAMVAIAPLIIEGQYYALSEEADSTLSDSALDKAYAFSKYCAVQPYYQWCLANVCLDFTEGRDDPKYARLAIEPVKRALYYNPHYTQLLHILGKVYLVSARYTKDRYELNQAEFYLNRAREKAPMFLGTRTALLELYLQKREYGKVFKDSDFILTIDKNNVETLVIKSIAYELKGDKTKAKALLSKASKVDRSAEKLRLDMLHFII